MRDIVHNAKCIAAVLQHRNNVKRECKTSREIFRGTNHNESIDSNWDKDFSIDEWNFCNGKLEKNHYNLLSIVGIAQVVRGDFIKYT